MNSLKIKKLHEDYKEMKLTYQNVVNANIKLSDENKYLTLDKKILQQRIDKAIELLIQKQNSFNSITTLSDVIGILRGVDIDEFYN